MKIYNTLSGRKEEFIPLEGNAVKMYACGITVSGDAHIGHAYQALIYDIIRKYLEKSGYAVTYARNYTDVDDKIIARSHETGIPALEYAQMMIGRIDALMRRFEVDDPNIWLKASENIDNIIDFVQQLIDGGHAYATERGDVYFAVESFRPYGKLSGRKLEDAYESVRIENEENKRNPLDFALWKSAKEGEVFWESPWGKGRPGWHIECSAMNRAAFGEQIDIHGGGRDLIFPHHENEIAQSEALTGKQFAKYWIHNGLIKVNGQKMSKSLGNSLLLEDLLNEYSAETVKYALLQTNYRGDINVTPTLFPDADKHMYNFYKVLDEVDKSGLECDGGSREIDDSFNRAMDDDFNVAKSLADLFAIFKSIRAKLTAGDKTAVSDARQVRETYGLLGLFKANPADVIAAYEQKNKQDVPDEVMDMASARLKAKQEKNWAEADRLRAEILKLGYSVKDTKEGFVVEKLS
ncbi:MAG: cysteine--tRNA ligase [Clostridiales bacterium]|nr:cysteine--tRNA ligase [Clostridiales bacterium]